MLQILSNIHTVLRYLIFLVSLCISENLDITYLLTWINPGIRQVDLYPVGDEGDLPDCGYSTQIARVFNACIL